MNPYILATGPINTGCQPSPKTGELLLLTVETRPLEVNIIDFSDFRTSDTMCVNHKQLGIVGVSWLKLFGIRQWYSSSCSPKYEVYYPEDRIDAPLKNIIELLACLKDEIVKEVRRQHDIEVDAVESVYARALVEASRRKLDVNAKELEDTEGDIQARHNKIQRTT